MSINLYMIQIMILLSLMNTENIHARTLNTQQIYVDMNHQEESYHSDREAKFKLTEEEVNLLAVVIMNEAGNQGDIGKRLVCDCVLNRVTSTIYPNTVKEVLNQPGQFYIGSVKPTSDIYGIIQDEILSQYDYEVMYFRTGYYHTGRTPLFSYEAHYFSK